MYYKQRDYWPFVWCVRYITPHLAVHVEQVWTSERGDFHCSRFKFWGNLQSEIKGFICFSSAFSSCILL